jgi:hypothetical protein
MNDDAKTAIARMIAQKNASKESKPVIKKKVVIKKQPLVITKKASDPDLSIDESKLQEIQNLMELIDIRKIVHDLVHEELQKLGLPAQKNVLSAEPDEGYIDDPMDVDLTWIENAKDLATVEGKIGKLSLSIIVDSASNKDLMPKFIADELGLKIDTSTIHNIRGFSGRNKSLGVASASIILAPGCVLKTDFIIIDNYPVRELILGRNTLKYRYNYDLHESRDHMAITCNGKHFFIPIIPDRNRQKKKASNAIIEEILA